MVSYTLYPSSSPSSSPKPSSSPSFKPSFIPSSSPSSSPKPSFRPSSSPSFIPSSSSSPNFIPSSSSSPSFIPSYSSSPSVSSILNQTQLDNRELSSSINIFYPSIIGVIIIIGFVCIITMYLKIKRTIKLNKVKQESSDVLPFYRNNSPRESSPNLHKRKSNSYNNYDVLIDNV